ncbi:MAG TPA: ABC transporter ATP-binding protein [Gaiellaceae bacterium]|nr:ABC transporter ATP-binding protein [Gaiellaceae bacterium]
MAAIEVSELARTYRVGKKLRRDGAKRDVQALRGVSFDVPAGQLFGLLGPNGAGKTTTIKILTTLLLPTAGTARVLGLDPARQHRELRRRIGYVFGGDKGLYERISALENLRYFADVYRVPRELKARRIDELLEVVGLKGRERERVETYSRGMRQRLHIARGLLHDPEVLFLDEPTIGLDPVGARELRETVAALQASGKTILLTTHYMLEADELCERVAVINHGQIVAEGTPAELKRRATGKSVIEIEAFGVDELVVERLRALEGVDAVSVEHVDQAQLVAIQSQHGPALIPALLAALGPITVGRVVAREPSLEDAYVELVST